MSSKVAKAAIAVMFSTGMFVVQAADWYVDDDAAAGGTGSEGSPFQTIQEAITASGVDDVIHVAEGVYDQGTTNMWKYSHGGYSNVWQPSRVYIDKRLTLLGAGRGKSVIRGDWGTKSSGGSGSADLAYRVDGVQCLVVGDSATGTVIRGFTFEKGAPNQIVAADNLAAGGVCRYSPRADNDFLVTDCEFADCIGRAAGGITGGTAIRCIFTRCMTNYGGASAYRTRLYNCLSREAGRDYTSTPRDFVDCLAVNCLTVNSWKNSGFGRLSTTGFGGICYNCATYGNVTERAESNMTAHNCISVGAFGTSDADCKLVDNASKADMTSLNVSPFTRNYKVVKGGLMDGKGKVSYLDEVGFIPASERDFDLDGNPYDTTVGVPIGVVMPTVEVRTEPLKFNQFYFILDDGEVGITSGIYVQSDVWPSEVKVELSSRHTSLVQLNGGYPFFPGRDGFCRLMLPPKGTTMSDVTAFRSVTELYVGGTGADDGNDGSAAHPLATIQAAVDKVSGGNATLIHVARGTYGGVQGRMDTAGLNAGIRATVVVPSGVRLLIRADEGPDVTFIEGAPDPSTLGCGADATCCVSANGSANCAFVGFTFRNGYAAGSDRDAKCFGSGFMAGNASQQCLDCVFTANHGSGVAFGGWLQRCKFTGNTDLVYCIANDVTLSSCILLNNGRANTQYILYNKVHAYNCSIYDRLCTKNVQNINGECVNCAYDTVGTWLAYTTGDSANYPICGSVIKAASYGGGSIYESGLVRADPFFRNPTEGDFCLSSPSEAESAGVATDPYGRISQKDLILRFCGDFHGNPIVDAEGRINAGAVNATASVALYVDAENGRDDAAHDGTSEGRAKRTLAAVMAAATESYLPANAQVIALPGHYADESMIQSTRSFNMASERGRLYVRSRVVVPENMTLIARDGPATTFIEGAADPDSVDPQGWGRGPNAIRCVFLEKNATVSGFTITGGRSDFWEGVDVDGTQYQDDFFTGGVFGRDANPQHGVISGAKVVNCVITNNYASLGGAGAIVAFHGSTLVGNRASNYGGAARHGAFYNCYIDGCNGPRTVDCIFDCINVTFGPNNFDANGSSGTTLADNIESGCRFWNVLCMQAYSGMNFHESEVRNSVFPSDYGISGTGTWTDFDHATYTRAELVALYDADGKAKACDAPSVDCGCAEAIALCGERDPAGFVRISNGMIDIGAFEYSWLGDYGKALGRRVEVTETEEVVETDGEVTMSDGGKLAATWTMSADGSVPDCPCTVSATLDGTGTLYVYLNGAEEPVGTLTESGTVRFDNTQATNDLVVKYVGEGSATLGRFRRELGLSVIIR